MEHEGQAAASSGDAVEELRPDSTGRWLVFTNNTCHVLDLDAGIYERRPGPASGRFEADTVAVRLTRVELWPRVGRRMLVWFDDPARPEAVEHWRASSPVRRIVPDDGPGAEDT